MGTIKTKYRDHQVTRLGHDINGNPKYLISWLSLDLQKYEATPATRRAGLRKYKGKRFGGGFVFQSYNLRNSLEFIYETIHNIK